MKGCKAIQYSDQMQCGACGLVWDVNDPDPPECNPIKRTHAERWREQDKKRGETVLRRLQESLK